MAEQKLVQALPPGFMKISVVLTEREHKALRKEALWLGEGTTRAALRVRAGLPESPYGLKAALARMEQET